MAPHFSICILPSELPLDASMLGVAPLLPSIDFGDERGTIWQTPIKALAIKNTDLDFSHVEPTCVLRGVVKYDPLQQGASLFNAQHVFETSAEVGIQIVQHEMDAARFRIDMVEQVLREGNKVRLGAMIGYDDSTPSAFGFHGDEQVASASTGILVIVLRWRCGFHRQGCTRILEQLLGLLVYADDGFARPERV